MNNKKGILYKKITFFTIIIVLSIFINFISAKYILKNKILEIILENNKEIKDEKSEIIDFKEEIIEELDSTLKNNITNNKYEFITNKYETDKENVEEYFIKGMSIPNIEKVLNNNGKYIETNEVYQILNYNFEKRLHYEEIESYLHNLNKSEIVKLEHIGKSVDNRKIYSIEIGNGTTKFMINANIHSAEVGNTIILLKYIIDLVNNYELKDNNIFDLLNDIKLVILPCVNPDGYEIYNFGIESIKNKELWIYQNKEHINFDNFKYNANGIDLNRNLPSQNAGLYYKKYNLLSSVSRKRITATSPYFGGFELGSEPETQSLIYFMLKHYKEAAFYIDMHSQGRVIYQGKPNLSDEYNFITNNFAKKISTYNNYTILENSIEEVGEGNDGNICDFMAELVHGFKFSEITGRLTSTTTYIDNGVRLKYNCPVIVLETLNDYTKDLNVFKNEYYNTNFYNMLIDLIKKYSI